MKKFLIAAAALVTATTIAFAADFRGGGNPSFVDIGLSLNAKKLIVGLTDNVRGVIRISAEANVTAECTSPGGNSKPVAADPVSVAGIQGIPRRFIVDGKARMNVVTFAPPTEIAGAPDCPSDRWTETITDLQFTSATITVEQPVGTVVLTRTCTFSPPTSNGIVIPTTVTCT